MGYQMTPTTRTAIRALTAAGLRHRGPDKDFKVCKETKNGEVQYTYVVFLTERGAKLALTEARYIEAVCRDYGYPFHVVPTRNRAGGAIMHNSTAPSTQGEQ